MSHKSKLVLSLEDIFCIACRSIMIRPVTMPCQHSICEACFHSTIECNKLECPYDKKRFGGWVRRATKKNELVNEVFWATIQSQYPAEVEKRLRDEDDGIEDRIMRQEGGPSIRICKPGELLEEFQKQLKEHEEILRRQREKEEIASTAAIRQLQREEEERAAALQRERELIAERDAEIAIKLLNAENRIDVSSDRPSLNGSSAPANLLSSMVTSTPKQSSSSRGGRNRLISGNGRGNYSGNSAMSSIQEKSVIGPLDNFIRPDRSASLNKSRKECELSSNFPPSPLSENMSALNRPLQDHLKLYFSNSSSKSPVSGSSKEGVNQFRPIRPSPLTPTKDSPSKRIIIPQTVKPTACRSFSKPSGSTSPKSSLSFSPRKCAFAFTSAANPRKAESDSDTDFEDDEQNRGISEKLEHSNVSELKELEEDIIRSYCENPTELLEPSPVRKPSQLQESNQPNMVSPAPLSSKRLQQEREDYELAVKLQEEFNKENRLQRQAVESNYELRNKRRQDFADLAGGLTKKRKMDDKKKCSKQRTISEAFNMQS